MIKHYKPTFVYKSLVSEHIERIKQASMRGHIISIPNLGGYILREGKFICFLHTLISIFNFAITRYNSTVDSYHTLLISKTKFRYIKDNNIIVRSKLQRLLDPMYDKYIFKFKYFLISLTNIISPRLLQCGWCRSK